MYRVFSCVYETGGIGGERKGEGRETLNPGATAKIARFELMPLDLRMNTA
jgi:hypothetical protein